MESVAEENVGAATPTPGPPGPHEELQKYKEQMAEWKRLAKVQLEEAAAKNKSLVAMVKQLQDAQEVQQAKLRVTLDKEFRERTDMKDDLLRQLEQQIQEMERGKHALRAAQVEELQCREQAVRQECALQAESELSKARSQHLAEMEGLQETIVKNRQRLQQLEQTVVHLRSRIHHHESSSSAVAPGNGDVAAEAGGDEGMGEALPRGLAGRLREPAEGGSDSRAPAARQPEALDAEQRIHELQQQHEMELQQLQHEIRRREEQLLVFQALLQQAQRDASSSAEECRQLERAHRQAIQQYTAKVVVAGADAARARDELAAQASQAQALEDALRVALARVAELETESRAREEAFSALRTSHDGRELVFTLQQSLRRTQEECKELRQLCETLTGKSVAALLDARDSGDSERLAAVPPHSPDAAAHVVQELGVTAAAHLASRAEELEKREAIITRRGAELEMKTAYLKSLEAKLAEQKREIAHQVSALWQQSRGTRDGAFGAGESGIGVTKCGDGTKEGAPLRGGGGSGGAAAVASRSPAWVSTVAMDSKPLWLRAGVAVVASRTRLTMTMFALLVLAWVGTYVLSSRTCPPCA